MMKVIKPFTTRVQRYSEGDKVPADADLSPHTAESLEESGFIADPNSPKGKAKKT